MMRDGLIRGAGSLALQDGLPMGVVRMDFYFGREFGETKKFKIFEKYSGGSKRNNTSI